jgi:hypothetical protein
MQLRGHFFGQDWLHHPKQIGKLHCQCFARGDLGEADFANTGLSPLAASSLSTGTSQFVWGDATSPDRRSVHATHLHPRTLFLYALYGWPLRGYAFPKARAVVNGLELSALSHEFTCQVGTQRLMIGWGIPDVRLLSSETATKSDAKAVVPRTQLACHSSNPTIRRRPSVNSR